VRANWADLAMCRQFSEQSSDEASVAKEVPSFSLLYEQRSGAVPFFFLLVKRIQLDPGDRAVASKG